MFINIYATNQKLILLISYSNVFQNSEVSEDINVLPNKKQMHGQRDHTSLIYSRKLI